MITWPSQIGSQPSSQRTRHTIPAPIPKKSAVIHGTRSQPGASRRRNPSRRRLGRRVYRVRVVQRDVGHFLPPARNETSAASWALGSDENVVGMIPFWNPGSTYALGLTIDSLMNCCSCFPALCAS